MNNVNVIVEIEVHEFFPVTTLCVNANIKRFTSKTHLEWTNKKCLEQYKTTFCSIPLNNHSISTSVLCKACLVMINRTIDKVMDFLGYFYLTCSNICSLLTIPNKLRQGIITRDTDLLTSKKTGDCLNIQVKNKHALTFPLLFVHLTE